MVQRREFFKVGVGAAGMAAVGATAAGCAPAPGPLIRRGPGPEAGIEHIVVVMMENRSYDHFMSWLPGGAVPPEGTTYVDDHGDERERYHHDGWASCGLADPDHSHKGGLRQLNGGAC